MKASAFPIAIKIGGGIAAIFAGRAMLAKLRAPSNPPHPEMPSHTVAPTGAAPITLLAKVQASGVAVKPAAALYARLKSAPTDNSAEFANLVLAFQAAHDSDPNAVALTGPLATTSVYDALTSVALSQYTRDPIPPATPPKAQPQPTQAQFLDASIPGAAASSGSNLYTYLKKHGNDKTAALSLLCKQFQLDYNSDPKCIGPAGAGPFAVAAKAKHATTPLVTDGKYGPATAAALQLGNHDYIAP